MSRIADQRYGSEQAFGQPAPVTPEPAPGRTYEVVATMPSGIPVSVTVPAADLDRALRRLGLPFTSADLDRDIVPVIVDIWPSWEAQRAGGDQS